jgi:hypothetical protein
MKKALAIALLMGAGCITTAPPEILPPAPVSVRKSLPPVTSEQITEQNGHQVAQALEEEINREQQQNVLNTKSR